MPVSIHICLFSLLYTIRHCLRTTTKSPFHEKNWGLWNVTKTHLRAIRHRQRFLGTWISSTNILFTTAKKVLCVCRETAYPGEHILWKSFNTITNHTLHTIRTSFVILSVFVVREKFVASFWYNLWRIPAVASTQLYIGEKLTYSDMQVLIRGGMNYSTQLSTW